MNYTVLATVGALVALTVDLAVVRTRLVRRRAFWTAYTIILGFQLAVNGVLTGVHVVRYDEHRIIGWRIAYAPVEDLLFGFAMVVLTLSIWVWLGRSAAQRARSAARSARPTSAA